MVVERYWKAKIKCTVVAGREGEGYVPREWMLAEGYRAAEKGDYAPLATLHEVLKHPYEEQPLFEGRFYKRAPDGSEQQGGIGFMS